MSFSLKFITVSAFLVSFTIKAGQPVCLNNTNPENIKGVITHATDILDFNAISDGKRVYVNWASGNEKNYDYYTIEKAKDGINFETAAMIKGAGRISSAIDYLDIDYSPYSGISYYRLKQTDYNGNISYSETVVVNYGFSKDGLVVSYTGQTLDPAELKALEGKTLLVVMKDNDGEDHVAKVELSSNGHELFATDKKNKLKQGAYIVAASSYNRLCGQKLTVK